MKILLISDEESSYLWDHYRPGRLADIDIILSAGDLKPNYLSFLVTMANRPLIYVHGNHDGRYEKQPPEGCQSAEDTIITVNGLRILGLGGSRMYNGGPHQYTEKQMEKRIRRLRFKLWRAGGVDIVLTHAPIRRIGDSEDIAHQGFDAFKPLLEKYKPAYFIHGHVHKRYGSDFQRLSSFGETTVINSSGRYVIEI